MRAIFTALLLATLNLPSLSMATAQIPDEIFVDNEWRPLHAEPLNRLLRQAPEKGGIALNPKPGRCTASYRGYQAFWRVVENRLYLEKVVLDPCDKTPEAVNMEKLFPGKPQPVQADWYTGVLIIPQGAAKREEYQGYVLDYERYVVMVVKRGEVVSRTDLDERPQ